MYLFKLCMFIVFFTYSFVQKPQKGVKFLQERGLLGKESKDVAAFFYEDDRLDRVCYNLTLSLLQHVCDISVTD